MHFYKKIDTQCTDNMDIEKTIVARMDETIGSAVETKLKADSFSMSETSCGEDSLDKVKKPFYMIDNGRWRSADITPKEVKFNIKLTSYSVLKHSSAQF